MRNDQLNFSLENSKNGEKTIKINNIYLHSKYDPIKEARSFVNSNLLDNIDHTGYLVLGLGLGYHVKELAEKTEKLIFVVESNHNLVNLANDICKINELENVIVLSEEDAPSLFQDHNFVQFLCTKPKTIVHPSSFKSDQNYYQGFLSYKSPNSTQDEIFETVSDEIGFSTEANLPVSEIAKSLLSKERLSKAEQTILATYSLLK